MAFGLLVVGPPGSGKTTYCHALQQFFRCVERQTIVVNLDPASENLPYDCQIDVRDLISLEDVMRVYGLGPNGGLLLCMEFLERNLHWLETQLLRFRDKYIVFDLPGQMELFTHHPSLKRIIGALEKVGFRLVTTHLVDAHHCTEPAKFVSALLVSLSTMLCLETPHINVLSKFDLVKGYGDFELNLESYASPDSAGLAFLLQSLRHSTAIRKPFLKLNERICELITDFDLVSFTTLSVLDKRSLMNLIRQCDKANGHSFGRVADMWAVASEPEDAERVRLLTHDVPDQGQDSSSETSPGRRVNTE